MNTQAREVRVPDTSLAGAPRLTHSPAELLKDAQAANLLNEWLASVDAATRVRWSLANLPGPFALSSSFGAQAAVSLHLVAAQQPEIPVVLVDTGYLFPETYQFIEQLRKQLSLNIQTFAGKQKATSSIAARRNTPAITLSCTARRSSRAARTA